MGTLKGEAENGQGRVDENLDGADRASTSLQKQHTADPIVYKLVRVEGDGRLVPATDDEVMEVDDMLEDDKGGVPLVADIAPVEGCTSSEEFSSVKANLEDSEGILRARNTKADSEKLNARLESIGVMLQKVKQEERLRLLSGSPDHSSDYMLVDGQYSDQHTQLSACDKKLETGNSLQQTVPLLSSRLGDSYTEQMKTRESCLKPKDGSVVSVSSASASCSSSMPDFSKIKGEICLDNLLVTELQETFKATFGRETLIKDKLWLKRRIAMGLINSCDVSTTTFVIKDNKLVMNKAEEVQEELENVDQMCETICNNYNDLPVCPTYQMGDRDILSGKRLRNSEAEDESKSEDTHSEQAAVKRARKPTKRYIEELSEADTREGSVKLVSSLKDSGHGQSAQHIRMRPVCDVGSDGSGIGMRQLSLGGCGLSVPYVSRIRRGRPRENFMPLMKYHPNGIVKKAIGVHNPQEAGEVEVIHVKAGPALQDIQQKKYHPNGIVKKAIGVHNPQEAGEVEVIHVKAGPALQDIQQKVVAEIEKQKCFQAVTEMKKEKLDLLTCRGDQQQAEELEKLDFSYGYNSDYDATVTLPAPNSGTRRKHHRAWSLCEVIKLVEGVSRYGAGRWSEIKRVAFASAEYRTSVDLKDKWRNLLRASFAQSPTDRGMKNSRKHAAIPIPSTILLRVRELAERDAQASVPILSTKKFPGCGDKNVVETRGVGYL